MSRQIKFRGKSLDTGEWVYGDLIENQGRYFIYHATSETTLQDNDVNIVVIAVAVDPDTIGQYTGLKDRNGKEIYEGDTVGYRFTDSSSVTGKVVWWVARCGFYFRTRENDYYELTEHCQVIDIIHDNPELLED